MFDHEMLRSFAEVVMIDLTLAGDNAAVIGLAAAGLPVALRRKAIMIGILAATILRIVFALFTVQLLQIIGLLLAGGILLLWVSWKMYRELTAPDQMTAGAHTVSGQTGGPEVQQKTLKQAITQIIVADVSMSLDNVLAVAGAASEHPTVLIFGLALSIVLMAFAANFIAKLLRDHRWIAYVGLGIILIVALRMIWHGAEEVLGVMA